LQFGRLRADSSQFRPPFTVDPATGIYTTTMRTPTGSPTDPPLTSYGVDQANALALHLLKLDPPIDQVYSSPYYRCLQTISPFVVKRNGTSTAATEDLATIRVEKGVGEWFGLAPWEHPTSAPLSTLHGFFPDIDTKYVSQVTPPKHGESLSQLHDRVAHAIDVIISRCDEEGSRAVVVCSHAAVVIALGRVLTGRMPLSVEEEDFGAHTCGLSAYRRRRGGVEQTSSVRTHRDADEAISGTFVELDVDHPSGSGEGFPKVPWRDGLGVRGGWTCEANSDCSFLKGGPERGW
jgi:transcription factor C subunit 7